MNIENIIFDLGGVIYNIRYENIADELKRLGVADFEKIYSQASQNHFIDKFEMGLITPDEFRAEIKLLANIPITDEQIDHSWNAILMDVPIERIELLGALKRKYQIFLYSNTNQINYDLFTEKLEKQFGFDIFSELFSEVFMSHQIGFRKPYPEGFQYILQKRELDPLKTLFIDDTQRHVEGAKAVGIQAYCLKQGEDMLDLFDEKLNIKPQVLETV